MYPYSGITADPLSNLDEHDSKHGMQSMGTSDNDECTAGGTADAGRASTSGVRARRTAARAHAQSNGSGPSCAPATDEVEPATPPRPTAVELGGARGFLRELRRWRAPAAFQTRLRVALLLVFAFGAARYYNGKPLELGWLFDTTVYASSKDSAVQAVVHAPSIGFVLLLALARFMLTRPQPRARPRESLTGLGEVLEGRRGGG